MNTPDDEVDPLAATVAELLAWLERRAAGLDLARQPEFKANVLLNALLSVLEQVRSATPDRHAAFVRMSLLALGDD